ncbi:protein Shroom [Venturia canescens]|uniref:protein Shroom n=1 Tax=Venturia canescens TaxID=32260 RepID=UPI001C9C7418|nr:protein Shroom [Venturia canescens]
MTDIQPSPPGYRGQDEAPGPLSCSPGSFKYAGHAHHPEHKQQQSAGNYVKSTASTYNNKESYNGKQSNEQQSLFYRRKSENSGGRRTSSSENEPSIETNNHIVNKKSNIAGYNDGYKKNTPGYKNDSGYSESIGFDSFSLPLNERDDASPPPTPPVRDASSLKGVCYGPGHEKYPSWPSAPERHPDEETSGEINAHGGSHRSKSWTDHTTYPKEKPAQYTRPLAKRPNPAFTQQLKTVMERCEKIPAETFESRGTRVNEEEPRLWPRVDREGKPLGDAEYVVPSPPEREQQQPSQTISHAELEAYVRSYQDPQVSQVDVYRETALTQAGLEEYTRVQHSQQASYAQSEGYHSYVSSVDSTTNTPFLDRLRRDSEAVAQRPSSTWEEGSREGRDSVVTTSSGGSASSSETLKWHGSMSDVSVSSGIAARQGSNDRWDRGSMSDVSSVNGLGPNGMVQKAMNQHDKWQSSMSDLTTSLLSPSSRHGRNSLTNNKWKQEINNKWQTSMNDRNCADAKPGGNSRASLPAVISHCSSVGDVHRATSPRDGKWQESSIDEENNLERNKVSQRNWESTMSIDAERYSRGPRTPESERSPMLNSVASNLESSGEWTHGSMSDVSQSNLAINSSKQLIAHSARVQTPQRHHSESVLYLDRERTQRKLYPISTTKPEDTNNQNQSSSRRTSPVSPQQAHLSVAERISELEKAQQTRYTYLDPDKRHRVSDPTLKAIQKKALLSFYERHQHQSSWRSEPQLAQSAIAPTAQSPPPQPPPRPRPPSSRRASSASDYSSGTWREKTNRASNSSDQPIPKHQHSNSCGSLSTDLLGPVIVGPAISIDDWVPERPPKKPHLRGAFNDRVPSPDLPPPSPPTVEETEVLNCDDPLPPPPPELSDGCEPRETSGHGEKRHRSSHQTERQSRRSKHGKREDKNSKSSPLSSPVIPPTGKTHRDHSPENFVRGTRLKHAESDVSSENGVPAGFATHRIVPSGRSSLRYPAAQKLLVNGRVTSSRRGSEERRFSSRPPARLPDLVSQRYSDSGNQRPAPQVPVETRIIRQESMRVESTRLDASGLLRAETCQRYETSTGQRPQPQVPICNNAADKNSSLSSANNQTSRPNYLPIPESNKIFGKYNENPNYSVGSPVKTGYEANSKLMAEASPQKYHEPPKYSAGHHQRHNESTQRYCYALANKYIDIPKQKPQPQCPTERYSTANSSGSPPPPPLAPRQNTPGRKSLPPPPRPAPPLGLHGSQSKASYLAYRRERGAPDSEGSYKRTMSPTARLEDWHHQNSATSREPDDPVLLRVTPHHAHNSPNHQTHNSQSQQNSQQMSELPKSHSVDALHQRIEERSAIHSNEVMSKLSRDLTKKLNSSESRGRTESNNNDKDYKERLSPQSVEVLNDRNRQLERERRKLAASCEPLSPRLTAASNGEAPGGHGIEDFYRERSATIEMTSRNVELLNRRNALAERRAAAPTSGSNSSPVSTVENPESQTRNATNRTEKPPPPLSSPPRSPPANFSPREEASPPSLRPGAVPRRTGSCSSSSSASTRSSSEANPPSRSSPRVNHKTEAPAGQQQPKATRELEKAHRNSAGTQGILRRKISSPSQTESSWKGANSPRARSSQTEVTITNASLRRNSSSRSRSSSLSSAASKISTSSSSSSTSPRYSPVETNNSPCVSPQPGIEGLTLLQRSEIVLRVNSTTIDASSQTEIFYEDDNAEQKHPIEDVAPIARRKLPEEIECEELSRDLANQLAPNDKLVPILLPAPEHKKPTDYVSGLFRVEATLQPRPRRPPSLDDLNSTSSAETETEDDAKNDTMPSTPTTPLSTTDPSSPLSPTSAYFTTSEGKARFLTRYSRDVTDEDISNSSENPTRLNATKNANDNLDLRQKKEELVLRLDKKVLVLRAEQEAVREEGELNEALGSRVSSRVSAVARPAEASKYRLHVEEVGKITSLLLGLSGRLARAENALYGMSADHPERKILESKRDKLMDQLEEAKILKSNIDKRSVNVSAILSKYLNDEEYADYQHFINMKAKLIMDGREIQDKVKLGEEQLAALKEAID